MAEEDNLTPEETEELNRYIAQQFPQQEEKLGVFSFLNKILTTDNTTKGSNLDKSELISVRTYDSAGLYAKEMNLDLIEKYLHNESEIINSTALSKQGFLVQAAITQKKEMRASVAKNKEKSGWFNKKEQSGELGGN